MRPMRKSLAANSPVPPHSPHGWRRKRNETSRLQAVQLVARGGETCLQQLQGCRCWPVYRDPERHLFFRPVRAQDVCMQTPPAVPLSAGQAIPVGGGRAPVLSLVEYAATTVIMPDRASIRVQVVIGAGCPEPAVFGLLRRTPAPRLIWSLASVPCLCRQRTRAWSDRLPPAAPFFDGAGQKARSSASLLAIRFDHRQGQLALAEIVTPNVFCRVAFGIALGRIQQIVEQSGTRSQRRHRKVEQRLDLRVGG